MYDMQKSQSMTGKLTRFIPGGNHAQLVFEVLGDDGKPLMKNGKTVVWGVETGSAANIAQERHHRGELPGRARSSASRSIRSGMAVRSAPSAARSSTVA